jgi:pilus assembly protein CpaE
MLKVFLAPHHSGLFALCAPETPPEADDVTAAQTANVLQLLRSEFAYVVVDTGAGIDEHSLTAIEASTDILLVGVTDVASVRALRKELDVLEQLGMVTQQRHLVLNRSDAKVGMDAGHIEAVLGMPIDVSVPSSRLVPLSANEGTAVIEGSPRTPIARSLGELVARFAPDDPDTRSGWFSRRGQR